MKLSNCLALTAVALIATACKPADDDDGGGGSGFPGTGGEMCEDDGDCLNGQSCVEGVCEEETESQGSLSGFTGSGPSGGESGEEGESGDACTPDGGSCEVNGDCCEFDGTTEIGAGLCVGVGDGSECTTVCTDSSQCSTGCCAGLESTDEYGACAPSFVCDGGTDTGGANEECIEGAAFFCACAAAADSPCTDSELEGYAAACSSGGGELYDIFICISNYTGESLDACLNAFETCIPAG